jgi:zinc finger protein AEBP2
MTAPSTPAGSSTADLDADVTCQWEACGATISPCELLEHLERVHVDPQKAVGEGEEDERFMCLWAGCKVRGKASCSVSWLERHVVQHGGRNPFPCIVPRCTARFPTQQALQRHVNAHFPHKSEAGGVHNGPGGRGAKASNGEERSRVVRKRSKVKRRRPQCGKSSSLTLFSSFLASCVSCQCH